ncbi:hypothetical protein DRC29_21270 [Salmonella enterica]|nr:hypothetical protein [Salmonella enterica]EBJ1501921.1 hypothetical protein [Salmonella enterica]EGX5005986.1 hypothetical protein [Salmonella enterica]
MARPASRKAVSSLPAIANIDEQLDEVVMCKDWQVLFNAETKEWIAYEISGFLSAGNSKRFSSDRKKEAIEYAEKMSRGGMIYINHSVKSTEEQWKEANSAALSSAQGNGYYPFNKPGWAEQSQQKKIF